MRPSALEVLSACSSFVQPLITLKLNLHEISLYQATSLSALSLLIHISPIPRFGLQDELKNKEQLQHSNILRLEAYFSATIGEREYRVIAQEDAGTLLYDEITQRRQRDQPYRESELKSFLGQLSSALLHIRSLHCTHNRICPFSIYVSGTVPKLGFFCSISRGGRRRECNCERTSRVDVQALGMTVLEMALVAYKSDNFPETPSLACSSQIIASLPYSPSFTSLLRDSLHSPTLTLPEIISRLSEPTLEYIRISDILDPPRTPTVSFVRNSVLLARQQCVVCHENSKRLPFSSCSHGVCGDKCRRKLFAKRKQRPECPECGGKIDEAFFDHERFRCCCSNGICSDKSNCQVM